MASLHKLEAFGDAAELAELCIETSQSLKRSLRDVRVGGPTGVAAASSSLAMARSLVSLSKTAADILTDAKSRWMLSPGASPPAGQKPKKPKPGAMMTVNNQGGAAAAPGGLKKKLANNNNQSASNGRKKPTTTTTHSRGSIGGRRAAASPTPLGSLAPSSPGGNPAVDVSWHATEVTTDQPAQRSVGTSSDDDIVPRAHLPSGPAPVVGGKTKTRRPQEGGGVERTPWERQMAKFKARQAQLKEHERRSRRAARKAFKEKRGVRLHRCAYSYATETLMVKRAGSNADPIPVIHHRAVNAAPERAAEEIIQLLLAVQDKLKMGVPIASLVNATNGEELDFEAYSNPSSCAPPAVVVHGPKGKTSATPRVFPPGAVYVALTAAEIASRRVQVSEGSFGGSPSSRSMRFGDENDPKSELAALPWMGLGSDTLVPEQAAAVERLARARPHHSRLVVHVTRAGAKNERTVGPAVPVMLPSSVSTLGEVRSRVSEALRAHEVAFTPAVALYHAESFKEVDNVTELADGDRLIVRCANDLAPGMGNNARAARRQRKMAKKMAAPVKGKVDSFKVAVVHRSDPDGPAASMRLPGAKALVHLTYDDICRRVRIAAGLPTDASVCGLFRGDGSKLTSPVDIKPGMRLLYVTKSPGSVERGGSARPISANAAARTEAKTTTLAKTMRVSSAIAPPPRPSSVPDERNVVPPTEEMPSGLGDGEDGSLVQRAVLKKVEPAAAPGMRSGSAAAPSWAKESAGSKAVNFTPTTVYSAGSTTFSLSSEPPGKRTAILSQTITTVPVTTAEPHRPPIITRSPAKSPTRSTLTTSTSPSPKKVTLAAAALAATGHSRRGGQFPATLSPPPATATLPSPLASPIRAAGRPTNLFPAQQDGGAGAERGHSPLPSPSRPLRAPSSPVRLPVVEPAAAAVPAQRNPSPLPSPARHPPRASSSSTSSRPDEVDEEEDIVGAPGDELPAASTHGISPGRMRPPRRAVSPVGGPDVPFASRSVRGAMEVGDGAPSAKLGPLEPLPKGLSPAASPARGRPSPVRGLMPGWSPPASPTRSLPPKSPPAPHAASPGAVSMISPTIPPLDTAFVAKAAQEGVAAGGQDQQDEALPAPRAMAMSVMDLMRSQQAGDATGPGSLTEEDESATDEDDDDLDQAPRASVTLYDDGSATDNDGELELPREPIGRDDEAESATDDDSNVDAKKAPTMQMSRDDEAETATDDDSVAQATMQMWRNDEVESATDEDSHFDVVPPPMQMGRAYEAESESATDDGSHLDVGSLGMPLGRNELGPASATEDEDELEMGAPVLSAGPSSVTENEDGGSMPQELDESLGTQSDLEEEIDEIPEDFDDDFETDEDDIDAPELP